jgi:hypothetical protein
MKWNPAHKCRACGEIVITEQVVEDSVAMNALIRKEKDGIPVVHPCSSPKGFFGVCDFIGFQPKVE